MNKPLLIMLPFLALLTGCETMQTPQQRREQAAREKALQRQAEERTYRMQGQVESVEMENARLVHEIQQLRSDVRSYNGKISQLSSRMSALEAKQAREMNEVLRRVEKLLNEKIVNRPSASRSSSANRGPGREHVVESGHTLSAIAQAYKTSVSKIKKANNLKNDSIYVGQKLFIPE